MIKLITPGEGTREEFEASVKQDLEAFNKWFQSLGNQPMVQSEVAIIKTYLYFKQYVEDKT